MVAWGLVCISGADGSSLTAPQSISFARSFIFSSLLHSDTFTVLNNSLTFSSIPLSWRSQASQRSMSFSFMAFASSKVPCISQSHATASHASLRSTPFLSVAFFNTVSNSRPTAPAATQALSPMTFHYCGGPLSLLQESSPPPRSPGEHLSPLGKKPPLSICPLGDSQIATPPQRVHAVFPYT